MTTLSTAIQHTRCWLALTAIHTNTDRYRPGYNALDKHLAKIRRWLDACEADIRRKKPSAAALREAKSACGKMSVAMDVAGLDGDALFRRWAASIWASLTLLEDCRNTCPEWFSGRHWRYLLQTTTTLAMALCQVEPGIDEYGTEIYEAVTNAA